MNRTNPTNTATRRKATAASSPALRRLVVMALVGSVVGILGTVLMGWRSGVLVGWIVSAAVDSALILRVVAVADGTETRRLATIEDDSRRIAGMLMLAASVVSLVGAGVVLHRASREAGAAAAVHTCLAIAAVVVSWVFVHTHYVVRYAHEFYAEGGTGDDAGVKFEGVELPDYRDFAYLSFCIGMTYQVADTDLQTARYRRVVMSHALLSYLFGAVIVAITINVMGSVIG